VVVYLKDPTTAPPPTTQPAVLDQINCNYSPHVIAMQAGQTLRVHNSDDAPHNIRMGSAINPQISFGQRNKGDIRDVPLPFAEPPFAVKCDVHPWMSAWIAVFNHPYFAVTGPDGSFEIRNVPPGKYSLSAWQESLVEQQQTVEVMGTTPVEVKFEFKAP
jgi:hypothetical protein